AEASRPLTMVEIAAVDGPLDERTLAWVGRLYGEVDPRYHRRAFLEHLFVEGPAGPALHAFATSAGEPVGHVAVVPTPARRGAKPLRAGKLEALVVADSHRGRGGGDVPVARTMLERLYERADAQGVELIHAYVLPPVGRVIGFTRLDGVGLPSLVAVIRPRNPAERALATIQRAARMTAHAALRASGSRALVRPVAPEDTDLLDAPAVPGDAWAIVANGALGWYERSPYVRVLELTGPDDSRGLVQLPGSPGEPLRVAAWHCPTPGTRAAIRFVVAVARLAEEHGATTLRLQHTRADPSLARAARALGLVRRHDLTTLWVRSHDRSLARSEAVVPTSMLYLGF
ncbi:MAG: GNAT family N-acetyltransferase, partial [Actinomycetota bacterium]